MILPGARRVLCAHADRDGAGMHWLAPGEVCPDLSQAEQTALALEVWRAALEHGPATLLLQHAPGWPAHDLRCAAIAREAGLGDQLLTGDHTSGRPFLYRLITRADLLADPAPREGCEQCPGGVVAHPSAADGRCRAAHADDPTGCDGQLDAVRIVDQHGAAASACVWHGAALLATLTLGRVEMLEGVYGDAIRCYQQALTMRPWPFLRVDRAPECRPRKILDVLG